jgi:hypothetical protein
MNISLILFAFGKSLAPMQEIADGVELCFIDQQKARLIRPGF